MTAAEHVVQDYASIALSLKAHPVSFVREKLDLLHIVAAKDLPRKRHGDFVKVAGLVLVRQRPGTASGTCFITLEDETGTCNLIVWASLFVQYRKDILGAKLLMAEGELQIANEVIHIIVSRCFNLNKLLVALTPVQGEDRIFPEGRNFK
jgi:error-prone DNA polymerase